MSRSLTDRELFEKFTVLRHLWASLHGFTIISLVSKYLTSIITTCYFPFYPFSSILFCCLVYSPVFAKVCSNFLEMFSQQTWVFFFSPLKKTVSEYQTKMSTQAQNGYLEAFFLFSLVTQLLFRTVFTLDAEKSICLEYVHMYIESLNTAMFLFQIMSLLALDFLIWYYRLFLCY